MTIKQSKSWRDVIEVHPAAEMFPLIEARSSTPWLRTLGSTTYGRP
jgi:hypothetical protein